MSTNADRLSYISILQQHNVMLAILCQHVDIKASIFLSFVSVMLFAYAFGPANNIIVLACAIGFAMVYPIRIGAKMLCDKPVKSGMRNVKDFKLMTMTREGEREIQSRLEETQKSAIKDNTRILMQKQQQNRHLIFSALLLFGYMMGMSVVTTAITSPDALLSPFV